MLPQIGKLPKGVNPPSANMLFFSGTYLTLVIKTGIITGVLSLTVGSQKSQFTTFEPMKSQTLRVLFLVLCRKGLQWGGHLQR